MGNSPFFTVHCDLPREGPGEPDDVRWALAVASTRAKAVICDAACGPGADTITLAEERPEAQIDAVDLQRHFVEATKVRAVEFGQHVAAFQGDYSELPRQYDLIWCAGAAYFIGYLKALDLWRHRLLPGGAVAFSEPVCLQAQPSTEVLAFWDGYAPLLEVSAHRQRLEAAGWVVLGHRLIMGAPWAAYYDPMRERLKMLRDDAPDEALLAAIEEAENEIRQWEAAKDEIAYGLFVVRPT